MAPNGMGFQTGRRSAAKRKYAPVPVRIHPHVKGVPTCADAPNPYALFLLGQRPGDSIPQELRTLYATGSLMMVETRPPFFPPLQSG